mmetsp:Transcript_40380/g.60181  ORF Transcript_40380/g.60181 Transcript_40380/m.60181 type:complete len:142 (-) Transcript_40380:79-504(-)
MIVHDGTHSSDGRLRQGFAPVTDVANNPHGVAHPAIRELPDNGEHALFLGRRTNSYILGLPVAESEALLDVLWHWAAPSDSCAGPPERSGYYQHRWRCGDLMVWDNRRLIHCRDAFEPSSRRLMWRTQVEGQEVKPARSQQ